jgi:drug/metabolite transporter (DMT)-like permease
MTATTGHWLIFRATELASAATIAPTTYAELVVAAGAGALLFGDYPDAVSVGGMALIVAAGLWVWRSQKGPVVVAETPD